MKINRELKEEKTEIVDNNPFQNDLLDREKVADKLEKIIVTANDGFVMAIDAGWGMGKTTFIDMWAKRLNNAKKYNIVTFNAWENDDCEDPLIGLISEVSKFENHVDDEEQKIKEIATGISLNSLSNFIKIASLGIVDVNINEIIEKLKKDDSVFLLYDEQKKLCGKFHEKLKSIAKDKKLIIFIDELDRCKPTFAVKLLERIKHLFYVENIIFILALNKDELICTLKKVYGNEIDSYGYLRRFIDLDITLPLPKYDVYCDFLFNKYNFLEEDMDEYKKVLKKAVIHFKLSLRDIDKFFTVLRLSLPNSRFFNIYSIRGKTARYALIAIYTIFPIIKIKCPDEYMKFLKKDLENIESYNNLLLNFNLDIDRKSHPVFPIIKEVYEIHKSDKPSFGQHIVLKELEAKLEPGYDLMDLHNHTTDELYFIEELNFFDNLE